MRVADETLGTPSLLICLVGFLLPNLLYANLHWDDRCEMGVPADDSKMDKMEIRMSFHTNSARLITVKYEVDPTRAACWVWLTDIRLTELGWPFSGNSLEPVWRQAIIWTHFQLDT